MPSVYRLYTALGVRHNVQKMPPNANYCISMLLLVPRQTAAGWMGTYMETLGQGEAVVQQARVGQTDGTELEIHGKILQQEQKRQREQTMRENTTSLRIPPSYSYKNSTDNSIHSIIHSIQLPSKAARKSGN